MGTKSSELASGLILILIGLSYGFMTLKGLSIGSPNRMGPGFFPVILSGLVALIGAIILLKAALSHAPIGSLPKIPVKSILLIASSILIIIVFIDRLGMAVTIFLSSLISSRAARNISWKSSLTTALSIAVICTIVFSYIMRVPISPFPRTWF